MSSKCFIYIKYSQKRISLATFKKKTLKNIYDDSRKIVFCYHLCNHIEGKNHVDKHFLHINLFLFVRSVSLQFDFLFRFEFIFVKDNVQKIEVGSLLLLLLLFS